MTKPTTDDVKAELAAILEAHGLTLSPEDADGTVTIVPVEE